MCKDVKSETVQGLLTLDCQAWPSCSACLPLPASMRLRLLTGVAYRWCRLKLAGCRGFFSSGLRSLLPEGPCPLAAAVPGTGNWVRTARYLQKGVVTSCGGLCQQLGSTTK